MRHRKFALFVSIALVAVLVGVLGVQSAAAQATLTPTSATPQRALLAYYNAINLKNYNAAYAFWINPTQTAQNFAAGFADTEHVEPYFGPLQTGVTTGAGSGLMPSVLAAYRNDGSVAYFWGCFRLAYNANAAASWSIVSADLRALAAIGVPTAQTINGYLSINCADPATWNVPVQVESPASVGTIRAESALLNYYRLVNARDYASAYALWLQPLPGPRPNGGPAQDYRPSYNQYVAGYASTVYVDVYLGSYVESGASAGHSYLNGTMPTVLIGQHNDGSVEAYYGCYVVGGLPNGQPGIVSGAFVLFSRDVPTGQQILQYLNVDCTSLPLQY